VAAKRHPDPVPVAEFVTSTTHKTLRGPRSGFVLCKAEWIQKVNQSVFPGLQGGPLMHVVAAKAIAFGEAAQPGFRTYIDRVLANATTLAEELTRHGFRLVSGGTDNHLMLVDVTARGLTGKVAESALDAAGITINKNMIPYDARPPMDPSGIRIGTPAITTRGLGTDEMRRLGAWISEALQHANEPAVLERVRGEVRDLCRQFPAPTNDE
jgi:glycine hydroxymethyltransferase